MPWHEYRARFMTERRIRRGGEVRREQSAALEAAARASGVPCSVLLGDHRRRDVLWRDHRLAPRDRRARHPRLRLPRAQQLLPRRARAVPADGARGIARPAGAARLVRGRDGRARSSCRPASAATPSTAAATVTAISGATGTTCSRASATISSCTAGARASLSWSPRTSATRVSTASNCTKLDLTETVGSLRERGVRFDTGLPADARAVLIELAGSAGPEYRVGFANFHAITRYNRSALYASAVNDLAEALEATPAPRTASGSGDCSRTRLDRAGADRRPPRIRPRPDPKLPTTRPTRYS